jgi:hypothetical protein
VLQTRRPKGTASRIQDLKENCGLLSIRTFSELFDDHLTLEIFGEFRLVLPKIEEERYLFNAFDMMTRQNANTFTRQGFFSVP